MSSNIKCLTLTANLRFRVLKSNELWDIEAVRVYPDLTYYFRKVGVVVSIVVGTVSAIKMPESYLKMSGVQRGNPPSPQQSGLLAARFTQLDLHLG